MSENRDKLKDGDCIFEVCLFDGKDEYKRDVIIERDFTETALKNIIGSCFISVSENLNERKEDE